MKNTFGNSITVTIFGESHGPAVGVVIDGLTPGLPVEKEEIEKMLSRRRPSSSIDTSRKENDHFEILSGVFNGNATGTPICITIPNENTRSGDYSYGLARPSHADYSAFCKYSGFEDYRGGGHFSGRITAALVAAGGILLPALASMDIRIGTHILYCGGIEDQSLNSIDDLDSIGESFPTIDIDAGKKMTEAIMDARENNDSIGGITQTAVFGLPAGIGEPWFDSVESMLSHALFSIGGIKGVEFGLGFSFAESTGSRCNDAFRIEKKAVKTRTNNNGGINGGISNGMHIVFQCAVKPTPSISQTQDTVDFINHENREITINGRHDPAIIRRICPVIDSVTSIVICDLLAQHYGTDFFLKGIQ